MTAKILVTGATGPLGSGVVDQLLTKTSSDHITVLVRKPTHEKVVAWKAQGVDVREGDYDNPGDLLRAFKGVDKIYFVSGSDIQNRVRQHQNVVEAAKQANVKHVVYTSFQRKDETDSSPIAPVAEGHIKTEKWLKESGLVYTILRHTIYSDMLPLFMGERVIEDGVIYLPAGNGRTAFALRSDMAEAGAVILTTEGHENKEYDITSDMSVSYQDIADILTEVTGKKISYVSPTREEFTKTLTKAGVPNEYIQIFAGFSEAMKIGEFARTSDTLEKLIHRKPTTVRQFLEKVYSKTDATHQ